MYVMHGLSIKYADLRTHRTGTLRHMPEITDYEVDDVEQRQRDRAWRNEFQALTFNTWMMVFALLFIERPYHSNLLSSGDDSPFRRPKTQSHVRGCSGLTLVGIMCTSVCSDFQTASLNLSGRALLYHTSYSKCFTNNHLLCTVVLIIFDGADTIMIAKKSAVITMNAATYADRNSCNLPGRASAVAVVGLVLSSAHICVWIFTLGRQMGACFSRDDGKPGTSPSQPLSRISHDINRITVDFSDSSSLSPAKHGVGGGGSGGGGMPEPEPEPQVNGLFNGAR